MYYICIHLLSYFIFNNEICCLFHLPFLLIILRPPPTAWGEKFPFNTVLGEFSNGGGGWIHSVSFSPSGEALAFAGHGSEISIVYPGGVIKSIRLTGLPYLSLLWTSEEKIIAAGYDCVPVLFNKTNEEW